MRMPVQSRIVQLAYQALVSAQAMLFKRKSLSKKHTEFISVQVELLVFTHNGVSKRTRFQRPAIKVSAGDHAF